jgi:hypothetical protein
MAHLLIIELPGGDDTDIVQAAIGRGDSCTFVVTNHLPSDNFPSGKQFII